MALLIHSDFNAAFTPGHVFDSPDGKIPMHQLMAGKLIAPSGRIVACDPGFLSFAPKPFSRSVPAGKYMVNVAVAGLFGGKDKRVACARIRFGRTKPVRWQLATKPGQDVKKLPPNQFYGFGVDTGTGCFVDAAALRSAPEKFIEDYWSWMEAESKTNMPCGTVQVDGPSKSTLVWFYTGIGDGSYPSFWGFDKNGRLATLDTDFGLLVECVQAEVTLDRVTARIGETLQDPQMAEAGFSIVVRRLRDRKMPLAVEISGPSGGCNVSVLIQSKRIYGTSCTREVFDGGERNTWRFEIPRAQLTREVAVQAAFTKYYRAL